MDSVEKIALLIVVVLLTLGLLSMIYKWAEKLFAWVVRIAGWVLLLVGIVLGGWSLLVAATDNGKLFWTAPLWSILASIVGGAVMIFLGHKMAAEAGLFGEICSVCHTNRTHRNERGVFVCADCDLAQEMATEPNYNCPVHQWPMDKEAVEHELIIDRCPSCEGVWLTKAELERWLEIVQEEAISSGHSSGLATGIAVGLAVG